MGFISKNPLARRAADGDNKHSVLAESRETMAGRKSSKSRKQKAGTVFSQARRTIQSERDVDPAIMGPTVQGREGVVDPVVAKKRRVFTRTLRKVMRMERELSNAEMAAMFDDDGDMGTAMRRMLLSQDDIHIKDDEQV